MANGSETPDILVNVNATEIRYLKEGLARVESDLDGIWKVLVGMLVTMLTTLAGGIYTIIQILV